MYIYMQYTIIYIFEKSVRIGKIIIPTEVLCARFLLTINVELKEIIIILEKKECISPCL